MYIKVEERNDKKFITINDTEHEIHWTDGHKDMNEIVGIDIADATAENVSVSLARTHDLNEDEQTACKQMILSILK